MRGTLPVTPRSWIGWCFPEQLDGRGVRMALSEKHRSELYTYFEPRLGGDVTEALIAEFPRGPGDEPVTRDYLDLRLAAQTAELRAELLGRMTTLVLGVASVLVACMAIATTVIITSV